ncbi:hypothetical protein KIW84_035787 [Lathyrus oleraceus]|uniref:Helicase SEN1 beta-barrel domain-containing protein n=1 Tax=Pisum sativum TaxID=3888 RepID=A0A9D4Y2S5_PEA|nr:hypothetical protein KIW84_035787 [Pisum sativum]
MSSWEVLFYGSLSVMSIERIDDFHIVRFVHDNGVSATCKSFSENDFVLLSKNPPQKSNQDVHMVGKVREEGSCMNRVASMPISGATWVSRPSNHQHSNVDAWRNTDSVVSYGRIEGAGKYMHHMEKNLLVLESLQNQMR